MTCWCKGCQRSAVCLASYGPNTEPEKYKDVPHCQTHLDEFWEQIKRSVGRGDMQYQARSVPSELKGD